MPLEGGLLQGYVDGEMIGWELAEGSPLFRRPLRQTMSSSVGMNRGPLLTPVFPSNDYDFYFDVPTDGADLFQVKTCIMGDRSRLGLMVAECSKIAKRPAQSES